MSTHAQLATNQANTPVNHENGEDFAVTRNACKLCTPLGATLAFKGLRDSVCILHGSQGCATYIRRYMISHFREPMDIASSNFTEHTAVFGGKNNLHTALDNLVQSYNPKIIGVATTCLAETIGEDLPAILRDWQAGRQAKNLPCPELVAVNTPSYNGTHREGFQSALRETVVQLALKKPIPALSLPRINLISGMVSPADLRWLGQTLDSFGLPATMVPDYSETLDGGLWSEYTAIPSGGTSLEQIQAMSGASATIELGALPHHAGSAGTKLRDHGIPLHSLDLPMGFNLTDRFLESLAALSGLPIPAEMQAKRSRLADSYVDAHKYLSGLRVMIYGEEDLVVGMASLLLETGVNLVLAASGGKSGLLESRLPEILTAYPKAKPIVRSGIDFIDLESEARAANVQLALGSSKGFKLARAMDIPLIRLGFPVHDRFGGQRIQHLGYEGAQQIFDSLINTVLEREQERNPIGYTYF